MSLPEGLFAEVGDGLKMHYHAYGEGDPVLFLHGSGPGASGYSNFRHNAPAFAAAGFQPILVDSLGYGLSSKPENIDYTLDFMSSGAVRLMDALGHQTFCIVGNSQGGAQAIRIALDHPDRVRKLILMAPGGLEERETYMALKGIRSMLRCIYGPEGITLFGMRKVLEKQLYDPSLVTDALVTARYDIAMTQPIHVFRSMEVDNQTDRLHEIACPILGLWGMNDVFCPPSGAITLAERCQDARVTTFTKCGHWVMVEHQAVFDRLCVDFLTNG
jgi:4,5:9,10-diseco-3-hydroxy-5,9,17-trioxoandrosta-1(10),2-diene-4-oate hydrolase